MQLLSQTIADAHQNADSNEVLKNRKNVSATTSCTALELHVANPHSVVTFKNILMLTQLRHVENTVSNACEIVVFSVPNLVQNENW